ncbi:MULTISPECIES: DUF4345 family protein [Marivita]|jgi:hypothetical protein|uniref:DUF4345 family protein n=1 Tax=Marivita cryptomonadis TaxID=505252 RepID=A0A9Q2P8E3_9RHOB|nr:MULTISPECIES: DUF4345 family protein [Marivita]MCR9169700.1 DUF4345 family protein [Paracoccaceae bacterium]MBM2320220.1 DUF4345 family protein [Marivita cryptomonadis]MBM2329799.1 DUF4345 family protein [Marivita cryptomonadis]MBM2339387.1 DUF4345 family protein [Marivita cryptomonadis]MBM2344045.1 DUF4345 family protein [Marivita cryptomonadis]
MIDILNIVAALLTIALGAFGMLAPRYTAGVLDLQTGETTMGLSELRASVGGMFVIVGAACLWLGTPWAYAMMGFVYLGAGLGRGLSLLLDKPPFPKAHLYFLFEAVFAAWLLIVNLPGAQGLSQ